MKKEDIKTISSLFEDALGVFRREIEARFDKIDRQFSGVRTDVEGMKILMVEHFTETDTKIEKIVEAMRGFLKLHDVLDGRVVEQDRKIDALERKVERLEQLVEKLAH